MRILEPLQRRVSRVYKNDLLYVTVDHNTYKRTSHSSMLSSCPIQVGGCSVGIVCQ